MLIFSDQLPRVYDQILNHPATSDDLRRATDAKIYRYKQKLLHSLESSDPAKKRIQAELDEITRGTILLGIPDELVWTVFLESKDAPQLGDFYIIVTSRLFRILTCPCAADYDFHSLRRFIDLFPSSPLTLVIKGFLSCIGEPPHRRQ